MNEDMKNKDLWNKTYYHGTFDELHASEDLVRKVMNMSDGKKMKVGSTFTTKLAVAVLALVIVLVGSNGVVYAATGSTWIEGVFRDIKDFRGAVIGTEYVQATSEVGVNVSEITMVDSKVLLPIEITFYNEDVAPFKFIEEVMLGDVKLMDENGAEIDMTMVTDKENLTEAVNNGKVQINMQISSEQFAVGNEYTLIVESFYGLAKADAPLEVKGNWKCKFSME